MQKQPIANLYLSIVLLLVGFGMVMVYSASSVAAGFDAKIADPLFFVKRQGVFLVIGLLAMFTLSRLDYHLLKRFALPIYGGAIVLLILTMVAGTEVNNAKRWIKLGPLTLQPSEIAKLAVVVTAAWFATSYRKQLPSFKWGFIPACMIVMPLSALIIVQPDLGTSVFVAALGFIVLLAGGVRLRHVAIVAAVLMPLVITVMFFKFGHVQDRILVFMDPEADRLGKGHQIYQSLIALGSGGFSGQGLGQSTQKLFFLPEEHTDFIFAIVTEELGFIGSGVLILLFAALAYAGNRVSKHAPDRFGALLALGFTCAITLQAAMNMAVVTASVPTKGISLPFISYGGTGLVVYLAGCGVVLNIARQALPRRAVRSLRAKEALEDIEINQMAEAERRPNLEAIAARLAAIAQEADEPHESEEADDAEECDEQDASDVQLDDDEQSQGQAPAEQTGSEQSSSVSALAANLAKHHETLTAELKAEGMDDAQAHAVLEALLEQAESDRQPRTEAAESAEALTEAAVPSRRTRPKVRRSKSQVLQVPDSSEEASEPYSLSLEPPKRGEAKNKVQAPRKRSRRRPALGPDLAGHAGRTPDSIPQRIALAADERGFEQREERESTDERAGCQSIEEDAGREQIDDAPVVYDQTVMVQDVQISLDDDR